MDVRHSSQEIETYVLKNRQLEPFSIGAINKLIGGILLFFGLLMGLIFWLVGLLKLAPFTFIPAGILVFLGLIFLLAGFRLTSGKPSQSTKEEKLRRILTYGKIIEANIDHFEENYAYQINGIPQMNYYLSFDLEKVRFSTFNRNIRQLYANNKKMKIYYFYDCPDLIVPYDAVTSIVAYRKEFKTSYRSVNISCATSITDQS